jgi:uncharacterized protein (TIGR02246 family)
MPHAAFFGALAPRRRAHTFAGMPTYAPASWLLLAALALAAGCARPAFDPADEGRQLLKLDAEWSAAAAGKDVEKVLSYFADDAVMMEPGEPIRDGKAAIREYVTAALATPGFSIRWVSEKPVFSPDGNMAYMRGTDVMTVPAPAGGVTTIRMRGVSIWRRDVGGAWRCVVDIGNQPPADAASPSPSPSTPSHH